MIDRALGVAGLGVGIITAALQLQFPNMASGWLYTGYAVGIFLVGVSVGLIVTVASHKEPLMKKAMLKIQVYSDHRQPEHVTHENIFRWYLLTTNARGVLENGETAEIFASETLFISFEKEVEITAIRVRSGDGIIPQYEVKDFNQKYAIICFLGRIPRCMLHVDVSL